MTTQIRWGILSTANIGIKRVMPAIQKSSNGMIKAVASRNLEKAQAVADDFGIETAYANYEDLLNDEDIDAIYIPLPNSLHAEWAIKCAIAGKATLCEKPLAESAEVAQKMVDTFKDKGVLFAEAFMYRFHPQNQRVRQMIQEGAIGTPQIMNATFSFPIQNQDNIRLSKELAGGALMDVGCYCVNSMRFIAGENPSSIKALADFGAETDVDEQIVGVLEFPSGMRGHFDASLRTFLVNRYEVRGSEGRIVLPISYTPNHDHPAEIHYWHHDKYEVITLDPVDQYQLMVEDFADALINQRPPRFDPQDAVDNMAVIDALLASARGD
ncbi:MAG: Gfo/Idh/MocA family oxidoreductase [Phototrophicaceae bacterium]